MVGPLPTVATRTPASAGPTILVAFRTELSNEFAFRSSSCSTNSGTNPRSAGDVNASRTPLTALNTLISTRL